MHVSLALQHILDAPFDLNDPLLDFKEQLNY
jgi:hypothetical protein